MSEMEVVEENDLLNIEPNLKNQKIIEEISLIEINPKCIESDQLEMFEEQQPVIEEPVPEPPNYFFDKQALEISRHSWGSSTNSNIQNYLKGCQWSPDGLCCLTAVNGDGMHIFEIPYDVLESKKLPISRPFNVLTSVVKVKEGGNVLDYCWFPRMHSSLPETCCWLASRQHEPIHMWDAFTGQLRCTYRGYDAVDEVEAALSLTFSGCGLKIFAGYKKDIKIFDTVVPGRVYQKLSMKTPASCLAHDDIYNQLAVGSWNSTVSLYDYERSDSIQSSLTGHTSGVTFLKYSSCKQYLIAGARKSSKLVVWDLRKTTEPLIILNREVQTNQKIYFDITNSNDWLVSGGTDGHVRVWNFKNIIDDQTSVRFPIHRDCSNGVSLHPTLPILATSTGQHHVDDDYLEDDKIVKENSLCFWWIGEKSEKEEDIVGM